MIIDLKAILLRHLTLVDSIIPKLCKLYLEGPVFRGLVLHYLKNWIKWKI